MTRLFFKLRTSLLLLVFMAIIPALGLILYTASEQRQRAVTEVQANAMRLTRLVAADQESYIEGARTLLITLARLPQVYGSDHVACNALFADLLKQYPQYANLGAAKLDGDIFCSGEPLTGLVNVADRSHFQRAVQTRDFAVGEYQIGRVTGKAMIIFGYPTVDETGQVNGVVFVGLDLAWLNRFVIEARLPLGATLRVIDRNGTILARYPDPEKWVGQSMPEATIVKTILSQREGMADAPGIDGVPRLYAFMPLTAGANADAYVSIGIPKEIAFAEADWILARSLVALGLVGLLAFAAAWLGGDLFVVRRVNALLGATKRLAGGDLSARSGIPYRGEELSQLARAFDEMAEALEKHAAEQQQAQEQILRQTFRAETLTRIAARLNAQLDPESVLNNVCEETAHALNVPAASVNLYDQNTDALYHSGGFGLPPEYGERTRAIPRALYDKYTQRMASLILFEDVQSIPDLPGALLYSTLGIRSVVAATMLREEQLIGSLNIFTFDARHFTEDELTLLKGIADEAALAITNSRLYDALQREERARADLLHKIITAQEDERMRIARELHDETSQSLAALMVGLDTLGIAFASDAQKVDQHLKTTKAITERMLQDIHRLIADLRPSILDDLGLEHAIAWYGEQRLNPKGIALHLDSHGLQERLPPSMETTLFRIVQEAMTNATRHAHASTVAVRLTRRDRYLTLQIGDDGCGFDSRILQSTDPHGMGVGLRGMRERASILGGEFHLQTARGEGTVITVHAPIPEEKTAHV